MAIANKNSKPPLFLYFIFLIMFLISPITSSITDTEALLQFKSSLIINTNALTSWVPDSVPCLNKNVHWDGVLCYEGIVFGLKLQSMGLSGKIDIDALSKLPGLRAISLEDNKFNGPIPEFNRLGTLKAIYLSKNEFSGQILPDYFSKMESLKKLWLSNNKFSGNLPPSLAQLRYLVELGLDNNQFSGVVPPLKQPPILYLNLSNNQLQGEIPMSLSKFNSSSFEGNPNLCGEVVGRKCNQILADVSETPSLLPQTTMESHGEANNNKKSNTKVVAAGVTVSVVILSLMILVFFVTKKKKEVEIPTAGPTIMTTAATTPTTASIAVSSTASTLGSRSNIDDGVVEVVEVGPVLSRKDSNNSSTSKKSTSSRKSSGKGGGSGAGGGSGSSGGIPDLVMVNDERGAFGMADLMKASAEVLGNGGMGSAYKAIMANGLVVAVKRMRELNRLEKNAFDEEIKKLASLRHKNILPPLAYHYRKEEKLVIYEYVPKGSLHFLLHGDRGRSHGELNWSTRLKIIKGITEGLCYLHSQLDSYELPHGNLKSSNILINLENEPLLSDFGFDPMANPNVAAHALFGYRSPEAIQHQTISPKCDIYCLGVVILEILTGKFPSQYITNTKSGTDVVQWVASAIDENREESLLDPDMMAKSTSCKDRMAMLLHIGVACTESNPDKRPSLNEVMEGIERVELEDGGSQDARQIQLLPSLRDGIC